MDLKFQTNFKKSERIYDYNYGDIYGIVFDLE